MSGLFVLLLLTVAPAKDAAPCVVSLSSEGEELHGLDLAELGRSIEGETRCDVLEVPNVEAPGFVLRVEDPTHAHLALTHADGRRLERDVVLDPDLVERVHALAIVASHMLRNEADELLASLGARQDPAPVVEPEPVVEPVVEPEPEPEDVALPDATPPSPPIVRLGLGGSMSSVPAGSGLDVTFVAGIEVAVTPTPWLAVGVRDLSGSGLLAPRATFGVGGAPFAELAWRFDDTWSIHGQLGVDLRVIGGERPVRAGVAPFVSVGARAQVLRELSIAAYTDLHVVTTEGWATALHLLPQAAILWSGGLSIAVHL